MDLRRDVLVGLRGLRRMPGVALLVVLTLGLAIGANAAVFSLIDRVAMRPLPIAKPHELVLVSAPPLPSLSTGHGGVIMRSGGKAMGMDYPLVTALRDGLADVFSAVAVRRDGRFTLAADTAIEVRGEFVNAEYFTIFGLRTIAGRVFTPAETAQDDPPSLAPETGELRRGRAVAGPGSPRPAEAGGPPVVVLNHGFWMRQFGGDRWVVDRTIRLNNVPVTVIGVLAPGYSGTSVGLGPELFLPLGMGDQVAPLPKSTPLRWDSPGFSIYTMMARLKAGVSRERAEAAARLLYQRLFDEAVARGAEVTEKGREFRKMFPVRVEPAGTVGSAPSRLTRYLDVPLRLLMAMTLFVLAVAAGNVANLLLARGTVRSHETAVCLALGARRWDLLRPRLVECLALAVAAGATGLLLAYWTASLVPSLLGLARDLAGIDTRPDARVAVFTAVVSVATGLFVWLASALFLTRRSAIGTLSGSRPLAEGGRSALGLRRGLVVLQVALSLALFCTSALLSRSLFNVLSVDPGFDADGLLAFTVSPATVGYEGARLAEYERTLLERVRALPGVSRAAATSALPLSGGGGSTVVHTGEQAVSTRILVDEMEVDNAFLATLGLPLVSGRGFDDRDVEGAPDVCVVNEAAARALAGRGDGVGQVVGYEGLPATWQVVGIVRDTRNQSLKTAPSPTLFRPRAQARSGAPIGVLIRTAMPGAVTAQAVGALVKHLDAGVAVTGFGSVALFARAALLRERMLAGLSLVFAGLSGLLAAMGLFGLATFNVVRRTREIGIRLALGATRAAVQRTVLGEVGALAAVGAAIGLAVFGAAGRVLRSQLFDVTPSDPPAIVASTLVLVLVACAAGLLPARRASRVDPAVTLRYE
jgi:predicted permease